MDTDQPSNNAPDSDPTIIAEVALEFIDLKEQPILHANHFVVQIDGDEIFIIIGQFTPPMLLGSAEERQEQARRLGPVPVKTVARLALSRSKVLQLAALLGQTAVRLQSPSGEAEDSNG
jgi:hypothetical protein